MKVFSVPVDLSQEHTSHLIYLSLNTFWHASSFSAPRFLPAKPPTLVVPVFILLCSLYSCSAPLPINLPLFLKFCIYILLRCGSPSQSCSCAATLRRRLLSSCSFCSQHSFTMLPELARSSHSRCVSEFTQPVKRTGREGGRVSVTELQQTRRVKRRGVGRL